MYSTLSFSPDSTDGAAVFLLHDWLHARFNLHLGRYLKNFIKYTEYPWRTRCFVRASGASCYLRAVAMQARISHEQAVCLSVRPSNAWIVTKRKYLAKKSSLMAPMSKTEWYAYRRKWRPCSVCLRWRMMMVWRTGDLQNNTGRSVALQRQMYSTARTQSWNEVWTVLGTARQRHWD